MSAQTDSIILTSMIVTLSSTVGAEILPSKYGGKGELPSVKLIVGTGLTYFGLGIMGDIAPEIAGPLAASIAVTALAYYGVPLIDNWFNGTHDKVGSLTT